MARKPSPRYYDSLKGYYCTIDKVRYELAKGDEKDPKVKEAAEKEFRRLMYMATVSEAGDKATCYQVINKFICFQEQTVEPSTFELTKAVLLPFIKEFAYTEAMDITEDVLKDWLRTKKTWGNSTRRICIAKVKAAFNHAVRAKILSANPLPLRMNLPPAGSRATDELITEEHHRLFTEHAYKRRNRCFGALLELLKATGARPAEIYLARVDEWREELRQFVIKPQAGRGYKTHKSGKLRIIHIPENLLWVVKELVMGNVNGNLFHTERKRKQFSKIAVKERFRFMKRFLNKERLKCNLPLIPKCITLYSYRHAFVTNWLMSGLSAHDLCQLIGTSMTMLERHYSHVMNQQDYLREQLRKFSAASRTMQGSSVLPLGSPDEGQGPSIRAV